MGYMTIGRCVSCGVEDVDGHEVRVGDFANPKHEEVCDLCYGSGIWREGLARKDGEPGSWSEIQALSWSHHEIMKELKSLNERIEGIEKHIGADRNKQPGW